MKLRIARAALARTLPLSLLLTTSTPALAIDKFWVCTNGNWSDGACWSLTNGGAGGAGEPLAADRVFVNQAAAADYTLTYNTPTVGTLANIVIQKTGLGLPTLLHNSGTIDTDALRIATAGVFTQTNGDLIVRQGNIVSERNNGLLLGAFAGVSGSVSILNLASGTVTSPYTSLGRDGAATINHSGGSMDAGDIEFEGVAAGAYNLSGTGIFNANTMTINGSGINSSVFTQTGGSSTVAGLLDINDTSMYDLQGGTLTVDTVEVRDNSTLSVGSTFNFNILNLQDNGTINGSLGVNSGESISISGGTLNGDLDVGSGAAASANLSGGAVNGSLVLGASGTASIDNVAITNTMTLDGTVNSIGNVVVAGGITNNTAITLSTSLTSTAGNLDNNGAITLNGGSLNIAGQVTNTGTVSGTGTTDSVGALINNGTISGAISVASDTALTNNNQLSVSDVTVTGPGGITNTGVMSVGNLGTGPGGFNNSNQLAINGIASGSGAMINSSQLTLGGTVAGTGGFTNDGLLLQSNSNISFSNSGGNTNNGTVELSFDREVDLSAADFTNNGSMNLRNNLITGTTALVVGATGNVSGDGRTSVDIVNAGTINASSGNLRVAGTNFTNSGLIRNSVGSNLFIDSAVVNHSGSIETNASGSVVFNSAITNSSGQSVTMNGGTLSTPTLTNASGGAVSGYGTLSGNLTNSGNVDLFGASTVNGDLLNTATGHVLVRNDTTLIVGHTTNNGTLETLNGQMIFEGGLTNNGALLFDPSTLTISDLTVSNTGYLAETGAPGDRIIITGDMINASIKNGIWKTGNTIFQFNGGTRDASSPQMLEAAGVDVGNHISGWQNNFAFGVLEIGTSDTYVKLADTFDNSAMCLTSQCEIWQKEAVYVGDLVLEAGTTLDLMGMNLYVLNGFTNNGGTILNGSVIVGAVPIPAAVWLFGSGILCLIGVAKRKRAGA